METTLFVMKGISCAGKSTIVERLKEEHDAIILSSDGLRESLGMDSTSNEVFDVITRLAHSYLSKGKNVIIDATNLTHKRHRQYMNIANKHNARIECHYVISHPYIWEQNAQERIQTRWTNKDMDKMLEIRKRMYTGLCFPYKSEFDEIVFHVKDIEVDGLSLNYFKQFYNNHKDKFLNNAEDFFASLYHCGYLKDVFPELYAIYNFNQENKHHDLTLEQHTFKLCNNLKDQGEAMIWAGILHDLGKVTKGIKQRHEDGNCSYIGHQGASTEIAYCVLTRLGFDKDFVHEVCEVVNKHMYLPYEGQIRQKTIDSLGQGLYNKLVAFRKADVSAKGK